MKNMKIAQLFGAAALVLALAACGGGASNGGGEAAPADGGAEATAAADTDYSFFAGQWRGSVEVTGETVYGTAGGNEQMLDVV